MENSPPVIAEYASKEWFYYDLNKNRHGPLSFQLLKEAWKTDEIDEECFVWYEGMDGWKQIFSLTNLINGLMSESERS